MRFDPAQSAGLFVGVNDFSTGVDSVQYAVDDAIDLAYAFAFEKKIHLVPADRIVLALQGTAAKDVSREKLEKLRKAGARIKVATRATIPALLEQQAKASGKQGLLVVSFATHGFSSEGSPYVLASDSELHNAATALAVPKLLEIAGNSNRSVVFIDACRDRETDQIRGTRKADPRLTAPNLDRMAQVEGQVVFYAAAPGKTAHPNHKKMNGVFTSAVLESLRCEFQRESRGTVTAVGLADYVERQVLKWVQENTDPGAKLATQVSIDGPAGKIRLASCVPPVPFTHIKIDGSHLTAYDANQQILFEKDLPHRIGLWEIADLNADDTNEAIVSAGNKIFAFDYNGEEIWSADTELPVRTFVTGDLLPGKSRQVVALSVEKKGRESRLTILDDEGVELKRHHEPGELMHLALDRPNTSHWLRIIVTAVNRRAVRGNRAKVFWFHPKRGVEWHGFVQADTIQSLKITDIDDNGTREICVSTPKGRSCFDFKGQNLGPDYVPFGLFGERKK